MLKRYRLRNVVPALAIAAILMATIVYETCLSGSGVYYCYQCGAKIVTTDFTTKIEESGLSRRAEAILGRPCGHEDWALDYANTGSIHADGFHERYVPLLNDDLYPDQLIDYLEKLPDPAWRKTALLAVGAKDNLLKWLAAGIVTQRATDLGYSYYSDAPAQETGQDQWLDWWAAHEKYFQIVTSPEEARELYQDYTDTLAPGREGKKVIYFQDKIERDINLAR